MDQDLTQNLTGRVVKAERDYFAYGGSADIWKGILTPSVEVRSWLFFLVGPPVSDFPFSFFQVAVKVPRVTLTNHDDLAKGTQV